MFLCIHQYSSTMFHNFIKWHILSSKLLINNYFLLNNIYCFFFVCFCMSSSIIKIYLYIWKLQKQRLEEKKVWLEEIMVNFGVICGADKRIVWRACLPLLITKLKHLLKMLNFIARFVQYASFCQWQFI